jgi:hypothetical protein
MWTGGQGLLLLQVLRVVTKLGCARTSTSACAWTRAAAEA